MKKWRRIHKYALFITSQKRLVIFLLVYIIIKLLLKNIQHKTTIHIPSWVGRPKFEYPNTELLVTGVLEDFNNLLSPEEANLFVYFIGKYNRQIEEKTFRKPQLYLRELMKLLKNELPDIDIGFKKNKEWFNIIIKSENDINWKKQVTMLENIFHVTQFTSNISTKIKLIIEQYDRITWLFNSKTGANTWNPEASSLILLDINEFKAINDTHGSNTWDQVLGRLWKLLNKYNSIIPQANPFRKGWDEFAVNVISHSREEIHYFITKICEEFKKIPNWNKWISVGVFFRWDSREIISYEEAIWKAEADMRTRKSPEWKIYRLKEWASSLDTFNQYRLMATLLHQFNPNNEQITLQYVKELFDSLSQESQEAFLKNTTK